MSNIRSLDLSHNKLEILKPWIGRLKLLRILNVENNKLRKLIFNVIGLLQLVRNSSDVLTTACIEVLF